MKMTQNTILLSACIISIAAISYCLYRISNSKKRLTNVLDETDIQRVKSLSMKSIIDWIDNVIGDTLEQYKKAYINILPNKATKEALKGGIDIPKKDLNKSILVIVLDKETKQVIKRKLVIPNSIADDLSAIRDGKIFEIPVE